MDTDSTGAWLLAYRFCLGDLRTSFCLCRPGILALFWRDGFEFDGAGGTRAYGAPLLSSALAPPDGSLAGGFGVVSEETTGVA